MAKEGRGQNRHGATLERGHLHEIHAAADDRAAALIFVLTMLEAGVAPQGLAPPVRPRASAAVASAAVAGAITAGAIVCIHGRAPGGADAVLYGAGLAQLGIAPGRLVIVDTRAGPGRGAAASRMELLRAGLEATRCPQVAAVVVESWGAFAEYDLTASRRLVLAAEASRTTCIMLRIDASPCASAAHSRWAVASARSTPFATAPPEPLAPGRPALAVELLRRRGAQAGPGWRLEWEDDGGWRWTAVQPRGETGAALPGAVAAVVEQRAGLRAV